MRQVMEFGDLSMGRGIFGGEFGARHCNQWGIYGVRVRQHHDAALFANYFVQTCLSHPTVSHNYISTRIKHGRRPGGYVLPLCYLPT